MKRLLWCLCLCSLSSTLVVGCGDDEGGGGVEDGGVSPADLDEVNDQIDQIETDLGELTENLDGLGTNVDDLTSDLNSLQDEVEGRLDDLENPTPISCSESELCIPDGLGLTTEGIAEIIEAVCEHEMDCCTETELNLKFGPGVQTVDDCVDLFNDMANNGFSPDFFYTSIAPSIVYQVIGVAQALNDPRVHVEIDPDGVQECLESLDIECPELPEDVEPTDPECVAPELAEADPCGLDNLLNGLQEEGELCGDYAFGEGEVIPECEDGFYCSWEAYSNGNQGICAKLPEEGDGCQYDYQCDPYGNNYYYYNNPLVTNLYCNLDSAQCEPLGDVGDECEFIDDTFTIYDPNNSSALNPRNRSATKRDCRNGLTCDPNTNECVANCSEGRLCNPYGGDDQLIYCGAGLVCNVTEIPALYDTWGLGFCADATADGELCTLSAYECDSGKCAEDCNADGICSCSEVLQPGDECETPGYDPACSTNYCNEDNECAELCNCDVNVEGSCDPVVEGPERVSCADGFYCDMDSYEPNSGMYACQPVIANGTACGYAVQEYSHASCDSLFCDPGTNQCAAKVAMDAACPSGLDEQCRTNQYCNNDMAPICRTYLAEGGNCDLTNASGLTCAKGLVCVDGTMMDRCEARAESGEPCDPYNEVEPECNNDEDPQMTCVDVDGTAGGTVLRCYSTDGGYADGVDCGFSDSYCASGWCRPDASMNPMASACAQPLQDGDDCDTADQTKDTCAEGLYCKNSRESTEGKCAEQQGPGGSCDPFFMGNDCIAGGGCYFTKDQYLCDQYSIDYLTDIFCGGN